MSIWQLAEMASERLKGMDLEARERVIALLDIKVTVLDDSREPALRVEGTLCHETLIDGLVEPGDLQVAGAPTASPHPPGAQ